MRETYCRSIGVEFMYIQEPAERQWLIDRMEPVRNRPEFSVEEKLAILGKLREAALFEGFLNRKFMGQTRFSLEGGEVLVPQLDDVVAQCGAPRCNRPDPRHASSGEIECAGERFSPAPGKYIRRI